MMMHSHSSFGIVSGMMDCIPRACVLHGMSGSLPLKAAVEVEVRGAGLLFPFSTHFHGFFMARNQHAHSQQSLVHQELDVSG